MVNARFKKQNSKKVGIYQAARVWFLSFLGVVILISAAVWMNSYLRKSSTFPIQTISLQGDLSHINEDHMTKLVRDTVHGGFFSLELGDLRVKLLKNNQWITDIAFRRVWPSTLVVVFQEQHALARWGDSGVLSEKGNIFYPSENSIPKGIPQFFAPTDKVTELIQSLKTFDQLLAPDDLTVQVVRLSSGGEWLLVLSNGISLKLGSSHLFDRMQRFASIYAQLVAHSEKSIKRVDLRYANGVAVAYDVA